MLKIFGVNFVWFWRYVGIKDWHKRLFSCPEQLNRWPCHSLTDWLTHSLTFTFAMQRVILETCGHWGIWSEWWGDMVFMTLSTFEHFLHFDYIEANFDHLKDSLGDLTFETSITILTIENLNSINHCYLTINCDTGQHSQFLWCFKNGDVKTEGGWRGF